MFAVSEVGYILPQKQVSPLTVLSYTRKEPSSAGPWRAYGTALALAVLVLGANLLAIVIRDRLQNRKW